MYDVLIGIHHYTVSYSKIDKYIHIRIYCGTNRIPDWNILQEVKDCLIGEDKVAIQVFPKRDDLIDNGNTYHLFCWDQMDVPNLKELYNYAEE